MLRQGLLVVLLALAGPFSEAAETPADYNSRGIEYYNAALYEDAIVAFEQAMKLAPDNETVKRNLANAYQAAGNELAKGNQFVGAIEYLEAAVQVDPGNAQPLIQVGAYYLQEGLVHEAIFRLEEAIELEPKSADAHFLLGEAYFKDNDAASALDQWEWVHAVDPERKGLADRLEQATRQESIENQFQEDRSRNFQITFAQGTQWAEVREILTMLEHARRDIGRDLGAVYPPGPIQVTLYSATDFSDATRMGEHVGALYDGTKIRVPVEDLHGNKIQRDELEQRLTHEYVHVVVRQVAKNNAPWWFNEGIAETMSREMTGGFFEFLRRARVERQLFALKDMEEGQLEKLDPETLQLAYRQSHATVAYLQSRFGMRVVAAYLAELGNGAAPETALSTVMHLNYETLQRATADFIEKG